MVRATSGRTELISSTVPLVTSGRRGSKRPVDLTLRRRGPDFVAVNPLERVAIGTRTGEGVSLGVDGIRVTPIGALTPGNILGGAVYYHNLGVDEDATVTPTIRGVELSTILRSKLSPEQIGYRIALPPGASLSARDGGAVIERSGKVLAIVPAPSAGDAQHTSLPVAMHVRGDELVLTVSHRSLDVAYPVMVDPKFLDYLVTHGTPGWQFTAYSDPGSPSIEGPEPGVLTAPIANYGTGEIGVGTGERVESAYHPSSKWEWDPGFGSTIERTTYEGVYLTPEPGDYEGHKTSAAGRFTARVGCDEFGNFDPEPHPSTFECNAGACPGCTQSLVLHLAEPPYSWTPESGWQVSPPEFATTLLVEAMTVNQVRLDHRRRGPRRSELLGLPNPAEPNRTVSCEGDPVNCATGNLVETQSDLDVPGRGVGLQLQRTYNSQDAAADHHGIFGYGWSWSFGASLAIRTHSHDGVSIETKTVKQGNGSTVVYTTSEGRTTTAPGVKATLEHSGGEYLFTLPDQTKLTFDGTGVLESEADRNGNTTTVQERCEGGEEGGGGGVAEVRMRYADYTTGGVRKDVSGGGERSCRIEVTDPSGRKLTLYLNAEGLVERATDPMGHTVSYGYEEGNLTSVTYPGESSPRWRFHYDPHHRMTQIIDGRGHATTNAFDPSNRVIEQTDRRGDTRHFAYEETGSALEGALFAAAETEEEEEWPELSEAEETAMREVLGAGEETPPAPPGYVTTITDDANGAVTKEHFGLENELDSITRGYGTAEASTESLEHDEAGAPTSITDGNGHTTKDTWDSYGNRTSQTDPDGDETKWEYDEKHDVIGKTTPGGEHTTIERDSHGNALKVSRPTPEGTQATEYGHNAYGELTSMIDPLEHEWKYEYDESGDRTSEIDPKGNKRTFAFNADSQEVSTTSPRGNVEGADPAEYTTTIERDEQGRVVRVIEPLQ